MRSAIERWLIATLDFAGLYRPGYATLVARLRDGRYLPQRFALALSFISDLDRPDFQLAILIIEDHRRNENDGVSNVEFGRAQAKLESLQSAARLAQPHRGAVRETFSRIVTFVGFTCAASWAITTFLFQRLRSNPWLCGLCDAITVTLLLAIGIIDVLCSIPGYLLGSTSSVVPRGHLVARQPSSK